MTDPAPLPTQRLVLLPLTRAVIERRLARDAFDLAVDGSTLVHFPPGWPGDALGLFPGQLARLRPGADVVPGHYTAVERATSTAVGQLGVKGGGDAAGPEIGYGFDEAAWGRGLATEAVRALCAHLLEDSAIERVGAETAVWNRASERVLEKVGFVRVGTSRSDEDGDLVVWRLTR